MFFNYFSLTKNDMIIIFLSYIDLPRKKSLSKIIVHLKWADHILYLVFFWGVGR